MSSNGSDQLTEDQIDDLLYFARTGELEDFRTTTDELSIARSLAPAGVLAAAIDAAIIRYALQYLEHGKQADFGTTTSNEAISETTDSSSRTEANPPSNPSYIFLNHPNKSSNTPLHWAALNGHAACVRLLVDAGADLSAENASKHDALDEAERAGRTGVVRILMAKMSGKSEEEIKELEKQRNEEGVKATQKDLEKLGLEENEEAEGGVKVS